MRRLNPNWFIGQVMPTVTNHFARAYRFVVFPVKFLYPGRFMSLVSGTSFRILVVGDVGLAIVVKEYGWVNVGHFRQPDGIAPRSGRVFGLDIKVAATPYKSCYHVKGVVMRIVRNCRGKNPCRYRQTVVVELRRTVKNMAQLRPVYQISTVKNRYSREK